MNNLHNINANMSIDLNFLFRELADLLTMPWL